EGEELLPPPEVFEEFPRDGVQPAFGRNPLVDGPVQSLRQLFEPVDDRTDENLFLRVEVPVEGSLPDAGLRRDLVRQDLVVFANRKNSRGGVEDLLPLGFRTNAHRSSMELTGQFRYGILYRETRRKIPGKE